MHLNSIHGKFMKLINVSFCGKKSPNGESNNGVAICKLEKKKKRKMFKARVFDCNVVT